jgi:hypothetical protein
MIITLIPASRVRETFRVEIGSKIFVRKIVLHPYPKIFKAKNYDVQI